MSGNNRIVGAIIHRLEQELEELKDVLSENDIAYEEMSPESRQSRSQMHTERRNKDGTPDRRFKENRDGSTGQGQVEHPETDKRLRENRAESAFGQTGRR